jgi:hypothetical protein
MRNPNIFPGAQSDYDRALDQFRRSAADLTDGQINTLRVRNPEIAAAASFAREYWRNRTAYQRRIDEAEYAKATDLRRIVERGGQSGPPVRASREEIEAALIAALKKSSKVVRLLPHLRGGRND